MDGICIGNRIVVIGLLHSVRVVEAVTVGSLDEIILSERLGVGSGKSELVGSLVLVINLLMLS